MLAQMLLVFGYLSFKRNNISYTMRLLFLMFVTALPVLC